MKVVVAIDGHLLLSRDSSTDIRGQREAIASVVDQLGEMFLHGHDLVITHGNSGQVGFVLLRAFAASHIVHTLPLDICGADTQGATGYMLQQELANWLLEHSIKREVATVITQAIVTEPAPETQHMTKGVGPYFEFEKTQAYRDYYGWEFKQVPGHGYQRVVPYLPSEHIVEANSIRYLFEHGVVVICAGGGGIPVYRNGDGRYHTIEAITDKSYGAILLAKELEMETVLFVSSWEKIAMTFDLVPSMGVLQLKRADLDTLIKQSSDLEDSMHYRLAASSQYLSRSGKDVWIVPPDQLKLFPEVVSGVKLTA